MQRITRISELNLVENNIIIGKPKAMNRSVLEFHGTRNVLFVDQNVNLENASIRFLGDNSIIFLSNNRHITKLKVVIYNNSVFYLGRDAETTRPIYVLLSEGRHIIIGDDCLFSRDVWFRNADPHLIYDCNTQKRLNATKSIFLGDHVWIFFFLNYI